MVYSGLLMVPKVKSALFLTQFIINWKVLRNDTVGSFSCIRSDLIVLCGNHFDNSSRCCIRLTIGYSCNLFADWSLERSPSEPSTVLRNHLQFQWLMSVGVVVKHLQLKWLMSVGVAVNHLQLKWLMSVGVAVKHLQSQWLMSAGTVVKHLQSQWLMSVGLLWSICNSKPHLQFQWLGWNTIKKFCCSFAHSVQFW